ncbi:MAG: 5'-methylthioadenosine/adenosylhomocysteine nucleosidase [Clostridia bacterium]|nr:5'-methylthioadenosine/adenosylhomocysteine nucleosidase [Clostridia bacterium]
MVGIIAAMEIEAQGIKNVLKDKMSQKISGIEFTRGTLSGANVVVCVCGIGKVFAAICTEIMILRYSPDCIINTGVAGTLTNELDIGDIAIGVDSVQHDMDTTPIGDPRGFISMINTVRMPCDPKLVECIKKAVKSIGVNWRAGTVASGDTFISSDAQKMNITYEFPDAVCCEMEGAAVGQVCTVNHIPYAIIRAISDNADGGSPEDFPAFAQKAAEQSISVVEKVIKMLD